MGKLAFIFPGQGSQMVGMGADIYEGFDGAKNIFDMAGQQVKNLSFGGPKAELDLTINAQPCLFAASLACAAALNSKGIYADGAAGFSLGEVTALAYCGLMTTEEALKFVKFRASAMHRCALKNKGGMLAVIGLTPDIVTRICAEIENAYPANFNCRLQTVVACAEESIDELVKNVAVSGGKSIRLSVSGAFHSPFMDEAKDEAKKYLSAVSLSPLEKPVYSNADAKVYENPKEIMAKQINSPVLWQKTIENMIEDGFDRFVEVGPGNVLSGLVKKISGAVKVFNVCDCETLEKFYGGKNA